MQILSHLTMSFLTYLRLSLPAAALAVSSANAATDLSTFHAAAPVLEVNCLSCHNATKTKGALSLETREAMVKGGDTDAAFVDGHADKSLLIERTTLPGDDDEVMPPEGGPLPAGDVKKLRDWIAAGAPWAEGVTLETKDPDDVPRTLEDTKPLRSIAVYPPAVTLESAADFHRIVVTATYEDDTTRDITPGATYTIENPSLVTFDRFTFRPTDQDAGETNVKIGYRGQSLNLPLVVKAGTAPRPISFNLDVMPVFMREGCNTGSCHGSARGQDLFMLSLFGYDPNGDYYRLTRELAGRRINLAIPEESLLIEKAIETVPHSGGKLFEPGSDSYNTLVGWIGDGVPKDPEEIAHCVGIEILPQQLLIEGPEATQRMTVLAKYSDGTDRDVTQLAVFSTNNERSAAITEKGIVTSGVRGEAFVMARFDAFTQGSQVIVIPENLDYQRPELAENNYIDELVHDKLHKLRIYPSELATDEVFLRRAFLDIVGQLPTEEDFRTFAASEAGNKREQLIDDLLSRKEFIEVWVMKFAELLQIRSVNNGNNRVSYKATLLYHAWLKDKLARNVPMDEIVKELLAAEGGTFSNPAANYYQTETDTLKTAENVAQVFMGMRLQCAQCHNHPFDRWTQNDYYGFAAFFTQIGRKDAEDPRERIIYNRGGGEVKHPEPNQDATPKFLGGDIPDTKGKDRRKVLVDWLASPENPYFARNLANIVWSHFFGIGIIEPVDDVRISNPATNPQLLTALGEKFQEYDYDFKKLVRDICLSRTYQLTTHANASNESDLTNFSHARVRRQRAEVLLDTLAQVTQTDEKFKGLPRGAHAVQIADGNTSNYFLTTFGRATRETVCSCEVKMDPNLGQALHLINGSAVHDNIRRGRVVQELVDANLPDDKIIETLYVRALSRKPTDNEAKGLIEKMAPDENKAEYFEDVFWALLNSKEYLFNH